MRLFFFACSFLILNACVSNSPSVRIDLDPLTSASKSDVGYVREHELLLDYLKRNKKDQDLLNDAKNILDAMVFDRDGNVEAAESSWMSALLISNGSFGERAFHGWARVFARKQSQKLSGTLLSEKILRETNGGTKSPWMISSRLQSVDRLSSYIQKQLPELIALDSGPSALKLDAPYVDQIPVEDPLLIKLATELCKHQMSMGDGWEKWRSGLHINVLKYFDALVYQCSNQSTKAIATFSEIAPILAGDNRTANLALESFSRLIKMRRDLGERESVAPLYLPYIQLWKNPFVTPSSLGVSDTAFEQKRIDETLWAVRSRASIGDNDSAKIFADDVVHYVNKSISSYTITTAQKGSLAALAAEANYILAFRLAIEEKNWSKAYSITENGLEQSFLPEEWRIRYQWSLGLYKFLEGDFEQARRHWEELLSEDLDVKMRPQLLFWTSEAHRKLNNESESVFYRKSLLEDYPLSFYSVAALAANKKPGEMEWRQFFDDKSGLADKLRDWQREDIDDLRLDSVNGPLLKRAEIFTSLGFGSFSNYALDDLIKSINFDSIDFKKGDSRASDWGLYISRLLAASGNWYGSITLTSKLTKDLEFWKKHPEQLFVYYPRANLNIYKAVASNLDVPASSLLGITRQESSFRVDAKSGANAWGLMQLTPPTAKRLLLEAKMPESLNVTLPTSLLNPEINIQLGALFYKELTQKFGQKRPQIYAAYNAGFQTVENWVTRRLVEDPILFIELIPYQETKDYVKNVWRNEIVYDFLL